MEHALIVVETMQRLQIVVVVARPSVGVIRCGHRSSLGPAAAPAFQVPACSRRCQRWPPQLPQLLSFLSERDTYDLIFADAPDGKWHGLDQTIAALAPHGMLVVDDMTPTPDWPGNQQARQSQVRQTLLTAAQLITVELAHGSGVILSTRR